MDKYTKCLITKDKIEIELKQTNAYVKGYKFRMISMIRSEDNISKLENNFSDKTEEEYYNKGMQDAFKDYTENMKLWKKTK